MKIVLTILLFSYVPICSAQQNSKFDQWNWLIGNWIGEGSGQTGQGTGSFSLQFDLDKNILVRKNHAEYPAIGNKPKNIHEDLMIIYPNNDGSSSKAIYFDNEGHTITYTSVFTDKTIILTSDKIPNMPVFRLTYHLLENGLVDVIFAMSTDGINFTTYTQGKCKRVN